MILVFVGKLKVWQHKENNIKIDSGCVFSREAQEGDACVFILTTTSIGRKWKKNHNLKEKLASASFLLPKNVSTFII